MVFRITRTPKALRKFKKSGFPKFAALIMVILMASSIFLILAHGGTNPPVLPLLNSSNQPAPTQAASKSVGVPADTWWNDSWTYRQSVNFTVPNVEGYDYNFTPIDVTLTFDDNKCDADSIRVVFYDGSQWFEVPSQVWNITSYGSGFVQKATVTFLANVTHNTQNTYYVYYNSTGTPKTYSTDLQVYETSGLLRITNSYYRIEFDKTRNIISYIGRSDGSEDWAYLDPNYGGRSFESVMIKDSSLGWVSSGTAYSFSVRSDANSGALVIVERHFTYHGDWTERFYFYPYQKYHIHEYIADITSTAYILKEGNGGGRVPNIMIENSKLNHVITPSGSELSGGTINLPASYGYFATMDKNSAAASGKDGFGFSVISNDAANPIETFHVIPYPAAWDEIDIALKDTLGSGGTVTLDVGRHYWKSAINFFFDIMEVGTDANLKARNETRDVYRRFTEYPINIAGVGNEETIFYRIDCHVQGLLSLDVPNALLKLYNATSGVNVMNATTDDSGNATFHRVHEGSYWIETWFEADINGYKLIENNTMITNLDEDTSITINVNIAKLTTHIVDVQGHNLANANVTLNNTGGGVNCTKIANLTGWAEFYTLSGDYNLTIYYDGKERKTNINNPISLQGIQTLEVKCTDVNVAPTTLEANATYLSRIWGQELTISVWFNDTSSGEPIVVNSSDGYINYTVYDSDNNAILSDNLTRVNPPGYYVFTLQTDELVGGKVYTIRITGYNGSKYEKGYDDVILDLAKNNPTPAYSVTPSQIYWNNGNITVNVTFYDTIHEWYVNGSTCLVKLDIPDTTHQNVTLTDTNGVYLYVFNSSTISSGTYTITVTFTSQNYTTKTLNLNLVVNPVPTNLTHSDKIDVYWNTSYTISVNFHDYLNNKNITNASISIGFVKIPELVIVLEYDSATGNWTGTLPKENLTAEGGSQAYLLRLSASKPNYVSQSVDIVLTVRYAPTTVVTPTPLLYVTEGSPYALLIVSYSEQEGIAATSNIGALSGTPITNASVSLFGIPLTQIAPGVYATIIPTAGLEAGTYPLIITLSSNEGYLQPQTQLVLLNIQGQIAGIPRKYFLMMLGAVAVPSVLAVGYAGYKRAKIPPVIRRIDELIKAISRGEKVDVKVIPRSEVIGRILREELAIVGVEPRVERYIPVELADRLVPLLVESGMGEKEAYALAVELKTATPAERERLLESVGVPGEISARVIQIIEEEEERAEGFRKPQPKPEPEKEQESPDETPSEESKIKEEKADEPAEKPE